VLSEQPKLRKIWTSFLWYLLDEAFQGRLVRPQ